MEGFGPNFGRLVGVRRRAAGLSLERLSQLAFGGAGEADRIAAIEAGRVRAPPSRYVEALANSLRIPRRDVDACRAAVPYAAAESDLGSLPQAIVKALTALAAARRQTAAPAAQAALLKQKTQEHRAIRKDLARMASESGGRTRLSAAVRDWLSKAEFTAAEAQLKRAEHLRLDETSRSALRRQQAAIVLLSCEGERASTLFESAAALLEGFAPKRAADVRSAAGGALHEHAKVWGDGYALAAAFFRRILNDPRAEEDPEEWAKTQTNFAAALEGAAGGASGAVRAALLDQAIEALRAAVAAPIARRRPSWDAGVNANLGACLAGRAGLVARGEAEDLFAQAADAYRASIAARFRGAAPAEWALCQSNLALALSHRAASTSRADVAVSSLNEAIKANREALDTLTEAATPVHWAAAQSALATDLRRLAAHSSPAERAGLLGQAVGALRDGDRALASVGEKANGERVKFLASLAETLIERARFGSRAGAAPLFEEAAAAARAARTRLVDAPPPVRVAVDVALAKALHGLAISTDGSRAASLIAEACAVCDTALRLAEEAGRPVRSGPVRCLGGVLRESWATIEPARADLFRAEAQAALTKSLTEMEPGRDAASRDIAVAALDRIARGPARGAA